VRRSTATVGSIAWFVLAAGLGAVWVPWLLTGWDVRYHASWWRVVQLVGVALVVVGLVPVVVTFARFAAAGGTPVPGALAGRLVVTGFNRYVRNPIYVGVLVILLGEALLLGQPVLLGYAALVWFGAAVFVRWYEEPALLRRFGAAYEEYRRAVPAWLPRRHPWTPGGEVSRRR
jgi:protein-S-isoprenylcysteine O-methyltransferase Ste14